MVLRDNHLEDSSWEKTVLSEGHEVIALSTAMLAIPWIECQTGTRDLRHLETS